MFFRKKGALMDILKLYFFSKFLKRILNIVCIPNFIAFHPPIYGSGCSSYDMFIYIHTVMYILVFDAFMNEIIIRKDLFRKIDDE